MKKSIFKLILIGLLVGFLAFFATRLIIVLLLVGAIFKLSGKGRREKWQTYRLAHADKIRNMSDEDYEVFKAEKVQHHCHR